MVYHCYCYYWHTNSLPMNHLCCWQVTGLYTPGRGEITSLDAGNIDDILSEFLPCVFVCLNEAVSESVAAPVVNVGVSYLMVLCHCSRSNETKPHVSLHRQCRGGSSQLLCRLVSVPDVCWLERVMRVVDFLCVLIPRMGRWQEYLIKLTCPEDDDITKSFLMMLFGLHNSVWYNNTDTGL